MRKLTNRLLVPTVALLCGVASLSPPATSAAADPDPARTPPSEPSAQSRPAERWVSIANPKFRNLKARFWVGTRGGKEKFEASTHEVAARVYQLDEAESKWDYYGIRITTRLASARENGGGGEWMEFSAWTPKSTKDTSYTRAHSGKRSSCLDLSVSLNGSLGPFGASLSKAFPVFCSASAKASLTTDYRGGRWRLTRPDLARSAAFHKVIMVRKGATAPFTVKLRAPCHYYDYHGGIFLGSCDQHFVMKYERKRI